jgi:hypothetical protein
MCKTTNLNTIILTHSWKRRFERSEVIQNSVRIYLRKNIESIWTGWWDFVMNVMNPHKKNYIVLLKMYEF